ncbi:MAG: IclR family transcriptional regulator [Chloroflexota bacterium]|nr:IclR family transcriptional regulator [Chloroflexota bacterium]
MTEGSRGPIASEACRQTTPRHLAVQRVADILRLLSWHGQLGIREIGRYLEEDKSTVQRAIQTLEATGLIERDTASGQWFLGDGLAEMGLRGRKHRWLLNCAAPVLLTLQRRSREWVSLSVPMDNSMVHIDRIPVRSSAIPWGGVGMVRGVGNRVPMQNTAVGAAYLAELPQEERELRYREMDFSRPATRWSASREALEQELEAIRGRGYAVSDEEFSPGIVGLAAAVIGWQARPVGTISVIGQRSSLTGERVALVGGLVRNAAYEVSRMARWEGK